MDRRWVEMTQPATRWYRDQPLVGRSALNAVGLFVACWVLFLSGSSVGIAEATSGSSTPTNTASAAPARAEPTTPAPQASRSRTSSKVAEPTAPTAKRRRVRRVLRGSSRPVLRGDSARD